MAKLRKTFVISIAIITVLSMSLFAVPFEVGAAAQAGDLIKMDGLSSVYYLGADAKRYVFPNETTYFSWYADFSTVVTIPQSELESYPLGANVVVRPGTWLVKITTDPKVYAVAPNGVLSWVPDEATALALYGADWASRIKDVPDAFFTNYDTSGADLDGTAYPEGSLVQFGTADVYYIAADGSARKIADEAAFLANGWKWDDIISATIAMPTAGTDVTGAEGDVTDTSQGGGGGGIIPGAGTGLTVALASDTPVSANIPAGSPVDFLKLNFTASNDGPVNLNQIVLRAYDLGVSTYLDSVTFYDMGMKIGTSKNVNSDRIATFNFPTPIVVDAGTTKSLLVRAKVETGQSGNFALGVESASTVITNGAVVSGTFPMIGNSQAIVSGTAIGAVAMQSAQTGSVNADFGEDNVLLADFNLAVSNEPVLWESARFRNGGTNNSDIVDNLTLFIDGDEVATSDGIVDKYASFDLGNFLIAKNDTISVEVYGDIGVANVNNTVNLYVKEANDFSFLGQDFGFGIEPTLDTNLDGAGDGYIITLAAGDFTIDMDKGATPAKDVRAGDDDVVLATIKLLSSGENATVNYIKDSGADDFYITGTGLTCAEIENAELKNVDTGIIYDVTIASSSLSTANTCVLTMDEEIAMTKGVTKTYELRVDLLGPNDGNQIDDDDTLKVVLEDGAFSITGDESDANITNITPNSVSGAIATVKAASLKWTTKSLTSKSIVPGAQDVVVYKAGLDVGESSYVDLTSVRIDVYTDDGDVNGSFIDSNVSKLELYLIDASGEKLLKTKSNAITEAATPGGYISFTSLDNTNRRLAAGWEGYAEVRASFASSFATTSTFALNVDSNARIVSKDQDNNNVDESVTVTTGSRSVTLATAGTLKVELDTSDNNADVDTYILAGSETTADRYMGMLKLTTTNEDVKIKTLVLGQNASTTGADISRITLYDKDGVEVAHTAPTASGHANFDSLNVVIPADEVTDWYIGITTNPINKTDDGTATYGAVCQYGLASTGVLTNVQIGALAGEAVTAEGVDSSEPIALTEATGKVVAGQYEGSSTTTKEAFVTGSVLTTLENDFDDTATLSSGGSDTIIGRYKVVFDNGANTTGAGAELKAQLGTMVFTISSSTEVHIPASTVQAYLTSDPGTKTTGVPVVGAGTATIDMSGLDKVDGEDVIVIEADLVVGGTNTSEHIQTKYSTLSSDFAYNGNDGTGKTLAGPRLDITELTGGKLYR